MRGAGGTPGGLGTFFFGAAMAAAGAYLLLTRVVVASSPWSLWGVNAFGLSMLPLVVGVGLLFFDGRSLPGWALTALGALIVVVGIVANLRMYFRPTTLFDTLLMLVLLAGGLGMIARSLRALPSSPAPDRA
jgi:uncharacterized protein